MCGLFGSLGYPMVNTAAVFTALQERGPDDRGHWKEEMRTDGIELLHTRLAIQDCSPLGHQPMVSGNGRLALVFNGEIYNQKDLRATLELEGWTFRSSCDTEVLLNGFLHWGQDLWDKLNGIFAAACWEIDSRRLTLARDRFGVKPLLWSHQANGRCLFASELSALMASGCIGTARINPQALESYRLWGAIAAPYSLLTDIHSLHAGHTAVREPDGQWHLQSFSKRKLSTQDSSDWTLKSATNAIEESLSRAVALQSIGDHPVGMYLSGGIDSGLLAAILKEHQAQTVHSVSVGFQGLEGAVDESDRAAATAAHLGLCHRTLRIGREQLDQQFDSFISAIDQPSIDGFNTFLVTTAAREEGMRVAFSGLGADEIFGGYPHMLLGSLAKASQARYIRINGLSRSIRNRLNKERLQRAGLSTIAGNAGQQACSRLELTGYLQETLLRDADVTTMAQGLELRVPFLDQDLVELAHRIPQHLHQAEGQKTLLRRLAASHLPAEVLKAPKQGFNLALAPWLLQRRRFQPHRIGAILNQALSRHNLYLPHHSLIGSWLLLKTTGRIAPYWRWVVLAEWLLQTNL